ncbi:non-specific lipid transfer protein GPI-anchored 12-like [Typha latifolia]|uniref:non-specific lipid transfer protein GPI-anchored 12-like n=1 Tax=Typha latifolia TaxID=4733 RepID=UPI003C2F83E0
MPSSPLTLIPLLLLSILCQLQAQVPAPAPALDCETALLNLSKCLTYVEDGSNLTRPEKGCCSDLAGVLNDEPICLCQLIGGYDNFGVKIDVIKVLILPTICRVHAPPANLCAVLGVPVANVAPSSGGPEEPAESPTRSRMPPPAAAAAAAATPPCSDGGGGGLSYRTCSSLSTFFFILAITLYHPRCNLLINFHN